jgi:hypothetical protein
MAAEPDYTLSCNIGVTTDYRFRGISQTSFKPALQAGADFAHKQRRLPGRLGFECELGRKTCAGHQRRHWKSTCTAVTRASWRRTWALTSGIIGYILPL